MHLTIASDNNYSAFDLSELGLDGVDNLTSISSVNYNSFPILFEHKFEQYFQSNPKSEVLILDFEFENISSAYSELVWKQKFDNFKHNVELKYFADLVIKLSQEFDYVFIPELTSTLINFKFKPACYSNPQSLQTICAKANIFLVETLADYPNVKLLPKILDEFKASALREKQRIITKNRYFEHEYIRNLKQIDQMISYLEKPKKKVLAIDLDNTLWGGVIGEDGLDQIRIGGHDHKGEQFLQFQKILRSLKEGGILLTVVSKNNENDAFQVFDRHKDMHLKKEDFVKFAINWQEKSENIKQISNELSLALDSFVFIDDNPIERTKVQENLGEVKVFDFPNNIFMLNEQIGSMPELCPISVTDEDRSRTTSYLEGKMRSIAISELSTVEADPQKIAEQINLIVEFENISPENFKRIHQLINRTNQFSLTGRKYSEAALKTLLSNEEHHCFACRVEDKFGSYGLVCAVIFHKAETILVNEFSMSCRILGRGIEDIVYKHLQSLSEKHSLSLDFEFIETDKNEPMRNFLSEVISHKRKPL